MPGSRFDARRLAIIAVGGAVGAAARYGVAQLLPVRAGHFPWATFWTNVSGSFVIGIVLMVIIEWIPPAHDLRALTVTGFLGAYTTFSTFAVDTDVLVKDGHAATAAAYVAATLVVGMLAVVLGISAARRLQP